MPGRKPRTVLFAVLAALLAPAALVGAGAPGATAHRAPSDGGPAAVCLDAGGRTEDVRLPARAAQRLYRTTRSYPGPCADWGDPVPLGRGKLRTYAQLDGDRPLSLGFAFGPAALKGLPARGSDGRHCYDLNGDGRLDRGAECVQSHEYVLELPREFTERADTPFTWALANWNLHGHPPEGVYELPHFDFHFYLQPKKERDAIRTGRCGGMGLTDCEDYVTARRPVPARQLPADYADIGEVVARMGNHLTDTTAPEFHGEPFTQAFMYGAYDGRLTFLEPMVAKNWLETVRRENGRSCRPLKQPRAWRTGGWYPTSHCVQYRGNRGEFTVSLTGFTHRTGS